MASEMVRPISARAAAARCLVAVSMRERRRSSRRTWAPLAVEVQCSYKLRGWQCAMGSRRECRPLR